MNVLSILKRRLSAVEKAATVSTYLEYYFVVTSVRE